MVQKIKNILVSKRLTAGAALAAASGAAHAELPAAAKGAMDAISGLATDFVASAWPIAVIVVVGFVGIKLFKKSANTAT